MAGVPEAWSPRGGPRNPVLDHVVAVSVGIVGGGSWRTSTTPEDSAAEVDMNVVMTGERPADRGPGDGGAGAVHPGAASTRCSPAAAAGEKILKVQRRFAEGGSR